jgi:hypothetical protein
MAGTGNHPPAEQLRPACQWRERSRLRLDPGVRGVFIPEIAVKGYQEQELLLAPGMRIRIDKASLVSDRWYVLATALAPR